MEHQEDQQKSSSASVGAEGGATQERCIPIPRQVEARLVVVGPRQTDVSIAMGMQRTRDRLMAACTRYLGDDLDTRAIHPSQRKMTKRQQTGIRPMAAST